MSSLPGSLRPYAIAADTSTSPLYIRNDASVPDSNAPSCGPITTLLPAGTSVPHFRSIKCGALIATCSGDVQPSAIWPPFFTNPTDSGRGVLFTTSTTYVNFVVEHADANTSSNSDG